MFKYRFTILLLVARGFSIELHKKLTHITIPQNKQLESAIASDKTAFYNFTELVSSNGYTSSEHSVITEDGYILTMFRLIGKKANQTKKTPVLMMHGLFDSSDTWIVSGPNMGLAYILADQGYDVWCGNNRGNLYARNHVSLNPDKDPEFWDFTFHQHGVIDVPAMVDYVLEQTGTEQVAYIGHSQGTTDFFILGSVRPEYNVKFKIVISLAPIAWLNNIFSPLLRAVATDTDGLKFALENLGFQEVFGSTEGTATVLKILCQYVPQELCGGILFMLAGYNPMNTPAETLRVIFGRFPSGTSLDNFARFGRGVNEDRFRRYDYGPVKNLEKYGSSDALDYDLGAVAAPVALLCGKNDWLVSLKDVRKLRMALPNVIRYTMLEPEDWSHTDFIWGDRIPHVIVPEISDLFEKFNV